jgi:hypothetical protein
MEFSSADAGHAPGNEGRPQSGRGRESDSWPGKPPPQAAIYSNSLLCSKNQTRQ